MIKRLSRHNFIAGLILVYALVLVLRDALRIDLGFTVTLSLVLFMWTTIHGLYAKKRVVTGLALLFGSGLTLAVMDQSLEKWSLYLNHSNPLEMGLSSSLSSLYILDKWPDFFFYAVESVLQGADSGEQIFVFNLLVIALLVLTMGSLIYSRIFKSVHYGFFLIPIVLFVQQWFHYAESIQQHFSLYFIGFIMVAGDYARKKAWEKSARASFGLTHF